MIAGKLRSWMTRAGLCNFTEFLKDTRMRRPCSNVECALRFWLVGDKCLVHIDDILIFGRSIEEHNKNLDLFKQILEEHWPVINSDNAKERREHIEFLGYSITHNKIRPLKTRSIGIRNFPQPATIK